MLLDRYDPPAFMTDFDALPGARDRWSSAVSGWFDEVIASEQGGPLAGQPCQLYNAHATDIPGPVFEQAVVWIALPGTLRNAYGHRVALELSEHPRPLSVGMTNGLTNFPPIWSGYWYRPQDEYCEWRTKRDPNTGKIISVTFTSEPPEYWQALHGDTLPDFSGNAAYPTTGDPELVLELYRTFVDSAVEPEDLVFPEGFAGMPAGAYNPWNRWNTTDGIMHLSHPANSLMAEIQLGGDATIGHGSPGLPVTDPDALICCAGFGGANRTSDPTIGSSVNQLALLGFRLTLRNPVGLYMHHLDMSGFAKPDGSPVDPGYFHVLRGDAAGNMIERAEFRVPDGEGLTVSDLTIAGVPITLGSQIAEHMTVTLGALAAQPGSIENRLTGCGSRCCQEHDTPQTFDIRQETLPCSPTSKEAFTWLGLPGAPPGTAPAAAKAEATGAVPAFSYPWGPPHRRPLAIPIRRPVR